MPDLVKEVDGKVVSTCCNAELLVTRVVRDLVSYDPTGYAEALLFVRYVDVDCLDSETGYVVRCRGCEQELDVEVDEG